MAFLRMIQNLEAKNENSHQLVFLLGKKNHYQVKRVKDKGGKIHSQFIPWRKGYVMQSRGKKNKIEIGQSI